METIFENFYKLLYPLNFYKNFTLLEDLQKFFTFWKSLKVSYPFKKNLLVLHPLKNIPSHPSHKET